MGKFDTLQQIEDNIKQNAEKLKNCRAHVFIKNNNPHHYISKYTCQNCGGVVDETAKIYYELGRQHGEKRYNKNDTTKHEIKKI